MMDGLSTMRPAEGTIVNILRSAGAPSVVELVAMLEEH
jgi:hypothetical protein